MMDFSAPFNHFHTGGVLGEPHLSLQDLDSLAGRMTPGKRFSRLLVGVFGEFCCLLRDLNATSHWCPSLVVHQFSSLGPVSKSRGGNEKMRSVFPNLPWFPVLLPTPACSIISVLLARALGAPQEAAPGQCLGSSLEDTEKVLGQ